MVEEIFACGECVTGQSAPVRSTLVNITHCTSLMWHLKKESLPISIWMIEPCEQSLTLDSYSMENKYLYVLNLTENFTIERLLFSLCSCLLIDSPAAGAAISLRLTTAQWSLEMSGGCHLRRSSMLTAGRNVPLTEVGVESVGKTKCYSVTQSKCLMKKRDKDKDKDVKLCACPRSSHRYQQHQCVLFLLCHGL